MAKRSSTGELEPTGGRKKERSWRLPVGIAAGAIAALFAALNTNKVTVHWLVGTTATPLILVIALSFALGLAVGVAASAARRRSKRSNGGE
jgi:uncharacterized integral membrane protein